MECTHKGNVTFNYWKKYLTSISVFFTMTKLVSEIFTHTVIVFKLIKLCSI